MVPFLGEIQVRRPLICLLILIGSIVAGCEEQERERPDVRLNDGEPQVEVTVQQ